MWRIWKEEVCKIASRKIIWLGLLILLLFVTMRLFAERGNYSATIDGQVYRGQEAIDRDRALTAEYAGILTEEKVQQIYHDFGFYSYDEVRDVSTGNFCNEYITRKMTNYNDIDSENAETIQFLQGDAWQQNAAPLLKGNIQFDYTYGWNDLKETHSILMVMALFAICIIGMSPVYSEEYILKTANILLTTQRGKKKGIWMKITAALFLAAVVYCIFSVYLWLIYRIVYGTQGLDASPVLIGIGMTPEGFCPADIRGFFRLSFALGLAGVLLLTSITLAVSALCRNAFLTVVISLAIFFVPYVWMNVLAIMLSPLFRSDLTKIVSHFMVSMPFYLPVNWGFGFSAGQLGMHVGIAAGAGMISAVLGYWKFRNYQG